MPVSALIAVSETPNRMPEAAPSITPWCSTGPPMRGPMISRPPSPNRPASKEIIAGVGEVRVRAVHRRQRRAEQHQPGGGQRQADPLAAADLEAEQPLGHHRDEHHAGRERDLDHGHRRQRERGHVQAPAGGRDEHAQREPLRGVQRPGRAQRVHAPAPSAPRWLPCTCRRSRGSPRRRRRGRGGFRDRESSTGGVRCEVGDWGDELVHREAGSRRFGLQRLHGGAVASSPRCIRGSIGGGACCFTRRTRSQQITWKPVCKLKSPPPARGARSRC